MDSSDARSMISAMAEPGFHRIEDDLAETWLEHWAGAGVDALEEYLRKQAAFVDFLESDDPA